MARGDEEPRRQIPAGVVEADSPLANPADDDAGTREAQQLSRGLPVRDLRREAEEADHNRSQKFKDQFELMALMAVWILFAGFLAFGLVWAFHALAPQWGWLKKDQIGDIQDLLTGGIIAGLVADHVRKRMN